MSHIYSSNAAEEGVRFTDLAILDWKSCTAVDVLKFPMPLTTGEPKQDDGARFTGPARLMLP